MRRFVRNAGLLLIPAVLGSTAMRGAALPDAVSATLSDCFPADIPVKGKVTDINGQQLPA